MLTFMEMPVAPRPHQPQNVLHAILAAKLLLKQWQALPLFAHVRPTPTELLATLHALPAHLEVPLALDPLLLPTAPALRTPTVAQLSARLVLLAVPPLLTAIPSMIASA